MNLPSLYADLIHEIGDGTGMADSLLHIHAGMAVLILTRIITRRSLATPLPLLVVCVAEAGNEVLDRLHYGSWRWTDTGLDVLNTLFWPAIFSSACGSGRLAALLFQPHRRGLVSQMVQASARAP